MIALLAAAVVLQGNPVIEILDQTADRVSVQAVVKLPPLNLKQRMMLRVIAPCLGRETGTYTKAQIDDIAGRVGGRLRVTVMEDHLRISMDSVPADANTAVGMVGSILKETVLPADALEQSANDQQFRKLNFWRQALETFKFEPPKYSAQDIEDLKTLVFRPENVTLAVAGKLVPGQATERWGTVLETWQVGRLPRPQTAGPAPAEFDKLDSPLNVIEIKGEPYLATDAAFSTRLLALTALGTGKGASLWRVAREKLGYSYRQEAVLWPTQYGFVPRLLIVQSSSEGIEKKAEEIRTGLFEDVKAWTEEDRKRAIGMAEAFLVKGSDFSPLYFTPSRPVSRDLGDQAFLAAYWQMKTKARWVPFQLAGRLGFIELADLKKEAEDILAKATIRIYKAGS